VKLPIARGLKRQERGDNEKDESMRRAGSAHYIA